MSNNPPVGISDIAIYLPRLKIDHATLIEKRAEGNSESRIEKTLQKIIKRTGLSSMYFPEIWEDTVTMAAQAALKVFQRNKFNINALRYLVSGTETTVDYSKPLAAYVLGMLKKAGVKVPQSISTYQTQHACAGGTLALLGISALLSVCGQQEESGIVMCSDIARYNKDTSAEITQGAGAVAMLTETNPKLLELNLAGAGYSSKDVDDFFRPLGSETARVKGGFSVRCYMEAMESALLDHAKRVHKKPEDILAGADMFALHVPYPNLPLQTMEYLLEKYIGLDQVKAHQFLEDKGFFAMIHPASRSGNIYSGSLFLSLAFLLLDRYKKLGKEIVGKEIFIGSYGSGNTMVFLSGKIAKGAPAVIENWDLESIWDNQATSFEEYERWVTSTGASPADYSIDLAAKLDRIQSSSFYLQSIREDGYREYQYRE